MKNQNTEDLWYSIGYALGRARTRLPAAEEGETDLPSTLGPASDKVMEALYTVGAGTLFARLLAIWPGPDRPGAFRLIRAGAAGAAAAFLAELIRPALLGEEADGTLERELTDVLLSGAGRGLLYAAVVEPRIPAPPLIQGLAYGALEFALTPWGGLEELAGEAAPYRKLPVLAVLLRDREREDPFLAHVAYGVALALLYEG